MKVEDCPHRSPCGFCLKNNKECSVPSVTAKFQETCRYYAVSTKSCTGMKYMPTVSCAGDKSRCECM